MTLVDGLHSLRSVPDADLLRRLGELTRSARGVEGDLVAHIGEVDRRRLYTGEACASMFRYCTERLHLSEAEAFLRITAARASRQHPLLLRMLRDGRLHLSAIARLAPHLTAENRDTVLSRAVHRSKREILELVAELSPRPDAPALVRRLPDRRRTPATAAVSSSDSGPRRVCRPAPASPLVASPMQVLMPPRPRMSGGGELCPDRVDRVEIPPGVEIPSVEIPTPGARPGSVLPIAPGRYKVQFTAGSELRDKLERLQALMRASVPGGDLATIIEAAVTEKLARLEARRFARTERPQATLDEAPSTPSSRHLPAAVRRAVHERDRDQCAYRDEQGRRCNERKRLEYHHRRPFGHGGDHSVQNVALLCHAHNRAMAEIDFGTSLRSG